MPSSVQHSIARNTTVLVGAQLITWISSFVLLIFLPRYLGSEAYGRLYLAISISIILEVLIDFGGRHLIPKEISRKKSKTAGLFINYLTLRTVIWILAMLGLLIFNWLAGYPFITQLLIIILGFSKLWQGAKKTLRSCFQGHERMEYPSLGSIVERVFIAAAAVTALLAGAGAITIAIIMTVGIFLNFLVLYNYSDKIIESLPAVNWDVIRKISQVSIPYFMWSLFSVIYYRVDTVMLSLLTGDHVVGWYGAAYRFFDVAMVFPSIFTTVIFPIFSRQWMGDENDMFKTFHKSLKFMILLALPVSILIYFYSNNIVSLFFGLSEYTPSVLVLQIFSLGVIFVYIDFILGNTILASDKQKRWAVVGFVAIIVNIGLNYVAIPYAEAHWQNGGIGAAVTTLFTEIFIMISAFALLPPNYLQSIKISPVWGMFTGALLMTGCSILLTPLPVYWIVKAGIAAAIYIVSLWYMNVFDDEEQEFIREYSDLNKFRNLIAIKENTTV